MNTNTLKTARNSAVPMWVLRSLATIGFATLILAGILLAIYASRFMPIAANGLDSATVSLARIFTPTSQKSTLAVIPNPIVLNPNQKAVPTASTTGNTPIMPVVVPPKKHISKPAKKKYTPRTQRVLSAPVAGKRTNNTYAINGTTSVPTLHGLPDLTVRITAIGYLVSTSTDSFVATSTIPVRSKVAVKFTITNIGTNKTGPWIFSASIPTQINYIFNSPKEDSLNPGDHVNYILGFDQADAGSNQTISITANPKHTFKESSFKNNSSAKSATILGQ